MEGKIEVEIFAARSGPYGHVILLRDKTDCPLHRVFQILMSPHCFIPLVLQLSGRTASRPLTHHLIGAVISQLNARVAYSVITKVEDNAIYADLVLNHNGREVVIDCLPSDAFAICLVAKVPIFCDEKALKEIAITLNEAGERVDAQNSIIQTEEEKLSDKPLTDEDINKLGYFADFIKSLSNLDDLGKPDTHKKEGM